MSRFTGTNGSTATLPPPKAAKPLKRAKRVDFIKNPRDMDVLVGGRFGLSTKCIQEKTGYSSSQVMYRLGLVGITRSAYRNGESVVAAMVLKRLRSTVVSELRQRLR
jgi:hypothetical protein